MEISDQIFLVVVRLLHKKYDLLAVVDVGVLVLVGELDSEQNTGEEDAFSQKDYDLAVQEGRRNKVDRAVHGRDLAGPQGFYLRGDVRHYSIIISYDKEVGESIEEDEYGEELESSIDKF